MLNNFLHNHFNNSLFNNNILIMYIFSYSFLKRHNFSQVFRIFILSLMWDEYLLKLWYFNHQLEWILHVFWTLNIIAFVCFFSSYFNAAEEEDQQEEEEQRGDGSGDSDENLAKIAAANVGVLYSRSYIILNSQIRLQSNYKNMLLLISIVLFITNKMKYFWKIFYLITVTK